MEQSINCLIVDAEAPAHYVLTDYIKAVDGLQLRGQCYNAVEAVNALHRQKIDLLFLDVHMPVINGFEFIKMLNKPPAIILTTAHPEYALESYQCGVVDYLLKPVLLPRFLKAIDRFFLLNRLLAVRQPAAPANAGQCITVKADSKIVDVPLDSILYAQSLGNYIKLFTLKKEYLCSNTTADIERMLPQMSFMRIHKSYIVALERVVEFQFDAVIVNNMQLPVGVTYRRKLQERLKNSII